jgi:hypothetical protein
MSSNIFKSVFLSVNLIFFYFFEAGSHYVARDPSTSTSQVLGLQVCDTTPDFMVLIFFGFFLFLFFCFCCTRA